MQDAPSELKRRVPHDPKLWARNLLNHPNDPTRPYDFYTTDGEEFLHYLVDDDGPMEPQNWGDINVLLFARGQLKTWTCTTILGWGVDCYPSFESVATAPVDDQRYEVIERFKDKVEQSGLDGRRDTNKLSHQKFRNSVTRDDGSKTVSYSSVKSRSAWDDGDKLRGLHGHCGVIDESQDVDEGTFSTFLEAIDREIPDVDYFPTTFMIGTPKETGTFFHRLWEMSDQKTWDRDEREWIQQAEAQEFIPEELQEEREELRERLERLDAEADAETREALRERIESIEGFTVRGWHVDQYNTPLESDNNIAYKKETYSEKKFENEVLANFYTPENDLLSNDNVWNAFDDALGETPTRRFPNSTVYLTVDWGGGKGEGAAKTVAGVFEQPDDSDTLYVNAIKVLDQDASSHEECDRIDELMQQYSVDLGIVDEGYGDTKRERLQDEYGYDANSEQPIYGVWYGNVKDKEEIKWNRFNDEKRFFTAAKTYCVKKMVQSMKDDKIVLPKQGMSFDSKESKGTVILDNLTAPYTERRETQSGRTKVVVKSDRNDDVFDVVTYGWVAANMVDGTSRTLHTAGSVSRPGY